MNGLVFTEGGGRFGLDFLYRTILNQKVLFPFEPAAPFHSASAIWRRAKKKMAR
jgi:hypothetical protein